MKNKLILIYFLCSALLVMSVTGCGVGYKNTDLTGQVSVDGVPIDDGFLSMTPAEGSNGNGVRVPIRNGKYNARAVPVGQVRVSFTAVKKTGKKTKGMMGEEIDEQISLIPEAYNAGMTVNVTLGLKNLDFPLKTTPFNVKLPGSSGE